MKSKTVDEINQYWIKPNSEVQFSPRKISSVKHSYHNHPLLQLDELSALAKRLEPLNKCRFIAPDTKIDSAFDHYSSPPDGRTLNDVLSKIEEPGSSIALYDVQLDSIYREFLIDVRSDIEHLVSGDQKVNDVRGFIFISAPPSATPFHIDRENNFWLQIRGHKKLTVWDHRDRNAVSAADVEKFLLFGDLFNVKLSENSKKSSMSFDCTAGDGVFFPMTTPHMTESNPQWMNDEALTISMGMVFYSNLTRRHTRVSMMNHMLRRMGLNPTPPGESTTKDELKAWVGRGLWEFAKRTRSFSNR